MYAAELQNYLGTLIDRKIQSALMIWGKPGIGKSSIVQSVVEARKLSLIDVRLSQLMPSDLRGLPVPVDGITTWAPPDFLPRDGQGVLFLDELNMAPPSMQGVAQQLILDRRVGNYELPPRWLIWAAGNRVEDRAAVHEMPTPLANRFLHVELQATLVDFKQFAYQQSFNASLIGFLSFRPTYLHKPKIGEMAWPSPRSWQMANQLLSAGLPIDSAVGSEAAAEYYTYCRLVADLPDVQSILDDDNAPKFPQDPSVAWAVITALTAHIDSADRAANSLRWLIKAKKPEWTQLFAADCLPQLQQRNLWDGFLKQAVKDKIVTAFLQDFQSLSGND